MDDNKIQKFVGAGSVAGILLMIVILFSNGTLGAGANITAAAGLDSDTIAQMDEGEEMQGEDEMDEDEMEEMDDDEGEDDDEDEMDEDEDENEGGILGFEFGLGWFEEKD